MPVGLSAAHHAGTCCQTKRYHMMASSICHSTRLGRWSKAKMLAAWKVLFKVNSILERSRAFSHKSSVLSELCDEQCHWWSGCRTLTHWIKAFWWVCMLYWAHLQESRSRQRHKKDTKQYQVWLVCCSPRSLTAALAWWLSWCHCCPESTQAWMWETRCVHMYANSVQACVIGMAMIAVDLHASLSSSDMSLLLLHWSWYWV